MHYFYNLLTYLLLIPFAFYWLIKGIGNRSYLERLPQRFGFGFPKLDNCIWVHAVSVGEVQAAVPLVQSLLDEYPEQQLVVTTVTPTGAARVNALFGDAVELSVVESTGRSQERCGVRWAEWTCASRNVYLGYR